MSEQEHPGTAGEVAGETAAGQEPVVEETTALDERAPEPEVEPAAEPGDPTYYPDPRGEGEPTPDPEEPEGETVPPEGEATP